MRSFVLIVLAALCSGCATNSPEMYFDFPGDPEDGLVASSEELAVESAHTKANVFLTSISRIHANDGGPTDDVYMNMVVKRNGEKIDSFRKPPKVWKFDSYFHRKHWRKLNKVIWEGEVAPGDQVTVDMKVWEEDSGGFTGGDDQLGHVRATMTNQDGVIHYKFSARGGDTRFHRMSSANNFGFKMTGDGSDYNIYFKNWGNASAE